MKLKIDDTEKIEILKKMLPQFWSEATHWREDSWRFTSWLVATFITLSGIAIFTEKEVLFPALIMLALAISGTIYLIKNHRNYKDRLQLFIRLEEALLFFEKDQYINNETLIPKDKLKQHPTWKGQGVYIFIIWIVAIAAWLSLLFS